MHSRLYFLLSVTSQDKLPPVSGAGSSGLFGSFTATGSSSGLTSTATSVSLFGEPHFSSQTENKTTEGMFKLSSIPQNNALAPKNLFSAPSSALGGSLFPQEVPLLPQPATTGSSPDGDAASELTPEELKAFMADRFVLGKIPERLPPPHLC